MPEPTAVLSVHASVWTPERVVLLDDVRWTVRRSEHWALLGPNGAGKSTLLSLAAALRHPSAGSVDVLGHRLGRVDVRELRARIGVVDPAARLPGELSGHQVVLTGATGTVQPLWNRYDATHRRRADELLALVGCAHLRDREVATYSQGERARIRLARALMPDPALLLLDEAAANLDLAGREDLLAALGSLAGAVDGLASVLVTHHLEELPATTTHALLLRAGRVVARGPVGEVLTDDPVSRCFDRPIRVGRSGGRWTARLADATRRD